MNILRRYIIFAIFATVANILSQELVNTLCQTNNSMVFAMLFGTGVGLLVKYVLDKKYIYGYSTTHISQDRKLFALYTLMGIITTLIFWVTEFGFDYFFASKQMRYTGAILGLSIGYFVKYKLDKKYVFVKRSER